MSKFTNDGLTPSGTGCFNSVGFYSCIYTLSRCVNSVFLWLTWTQLRQPVATKKKPRERGGGDEMRRTVMRLADHALATSLTNSRCLWASLLPKCVYVNCIAARVDRCASLIASGRLSCHVCSTNRNSARHTRWNYQPVLLVSSTHQASTSTSTELIFSSTIATRLCDTK